jgi:hypothetical protein
MLNMVSSTSIDIEMVQKQTSASGAATTAKGHFGPGVDVGVKPNDGDSAKTNVSEGIESDSISTLSENAAKRSEDHEDKFRTPKKLVMVRFTEYLKYRTSSTSGIKWLATFRLPWLLQCGILNSFFIEKI